MTRTYHKIERRVAVRRPPPKRIRARDITEPVLAITALFGLVFALALVLPS